MESKLKTKLSEEALTLTLGESKEWLEGQMEDGAHCPLCTQYVKVYKRKLNSTMALALITFFKMTNGSSDYRHSMEIIKASADLSLARNGFGGDFGKLVHWGLIEEMPKEECKKFSGRTSGYWRMTKAGCDFVNGLILVPKYAYIFDSRLLKLSDDFTGVGESLGDSFNYEELMRS